MGLRAASQRRPSSAWRAGAFRDPWAMTMNRFSPITPGELLQKEFLGLLGICQTRLAKAMGDQPDLAMNSTSERP
ncbi:hypothetical protein NZK27_00800 [Synechococcus sp. FGCU-3]|nr:hypothetical protein [Synechococcus sp. FGCU3]